MDMIKITQKKSLIGVPSKLAKVVKALGLKGINKTVIQKDNNCTRGMVNKVVHLVEYELVQQ